MDPACVSPDSPPCVKIRSMASTLVLAVDRQPLSAIKTPASKMAGSSRNQDRAACRFHLSIRFVAAPSVGRPGSWSFGNKTGLDVPLCSAACHSTLLEGPCLRIKLYENNAGTVPSNDPAARV